MFIDKGGEREIEREGERNRESGRERKGQSDKNTNIIMDINKETSIQT